MDITTFLAQIWGPVLLAVGLGVFVSRNFYIKVYRDLEKDVLAVLTFGMVAMVFGIIQISVHNAWNTIPQIIVSLLGWGTLLKGIVFVTAPGFVDRAGDWQAKSNLVSFSGGLMLILGAYLSWIGYFV